MGKQCPAPLLAACLLCLALLAACAQPYGLYLAGKGPERVELEELFRLLDAERRDPIRRFAIARQISANLLRQKEYGRLAALLTAMARQDDESDAEPYAAWYLFTTAYAYELQGSIPIAALYYDKIVKNWPDLVVDGQSLHYECLTRLIQTQKSPERRIEYYKDILARFPDRANNGAMLYLLGLEYERVGDWELAVKSYSKYLPFTGNAVPGHPEALQHARSVVEFYNSPKDWTYDDVGSLVSAIKAALSAGSPARLRRCMAKVNFFAVPWQQDEGEAVKRSIFDFSDFMSGQKISFAPELDASSGPREAFLKTWGWAERVSTWYLYFRKIYFPADPEIHGRWEWAGVYFGEKAR